MLLHDECASPDHGASRTGPPSDRAARSRRHSAPALDITAVGQELGRYDQYMDQVRGHAPKTREGALLLIESLLRKHFGDDGKADSLAHELRPNRTLPRRHMPSEDHSVGLGSLVAQVCGDCLASRFGQSIMASAQVAGARRGRTT